MALSLMVDIEAVDVTPTSLILTIGAQLFDPLGEGIPENPDFSYYRRITAESQNGRTIDDGTLAWWGTQPQAAQDEAFGDEGRVDLRSALEDLAKMFVKSEHFWANGPTYDATIIENAYKSLGMGLPWKYNKVRDCRTVYSLVPEFKMPAAAHHALDDCWRQIALLQAALAHLGVKSLW